MQKRKPEAMDEHKKERLERKSASSPFPLPAPLLPRSPADPFPSLARRGVPKERPGTEEEACTARRSKARCVVSLSLSSAAPLTPPRPPAAAETGVAPVAAAASAPRRVVQLPDEYLPPNKILFVQNLPDDTTKDKLEALFRPCVVLPLPPRLSPARRTQLAHVDVPRARRYPNLVEVRTIPGRRTIAFVEFEDEPSSSVAREALHNSAFPGAAAEGADEPHRIKVTFAKKG